MRKSLEEMILSIGQAEAKANAGMFNPALVASVVGSLNSHSTLIDTLTQEKRTEGFGVMMKSLAEYLKSERDREIAMMMRILGLVFGVYLMVISAMVAGADVDPFDDASCQGADLTAGRFKR